MVEPLPAPAGPCPDETPATLALLRLVLTPGLGIRLAHRVLDRVGGWAGAAEIPKLSRRDLTEIGIDRNLAGEIRSPGLQQKAEEERRRAVELGTQLVPIGHSDYPALLMETADAPLVLYVRGTGWSPNRPHIAIVGARGASPYGLEHARKLARNLAARGAVIVSGLARGIDTAAHEGALDVEAGSHPATVAVLGTGVDGCYPAENRALLESIVSRGSLVSEFRFGAPPLPAHFPQRNRIIAGMTWGTIVVEARERSGSLITARLAAEANREVFAVPGPLDLEQSRGTHRLIRDGACLVTSAEDVLAEFPPFVRDELTPDPGSPTKCAHQSEEETSLSDADNVVLEALTSWEATPIDRLIGGVSLSTEQVYAALARLELAGLIDMLPGDRYVRKG